MPKQLQRGKIWVRYDPNKCNALKGLGFQPSRKRIQNWVRLLPLRSWRYS